jgi:FK506-binding nuclear protein
MQVGGERVLEIPATMAYGKDAKPGIPSNSELVFGSCVVFLKSEGN